MRGQHLAESSADAARGAGQQNAIDDEQSSAPEVTV
jgi:hypothetical protein